MTGEQIKSPALSEADRRSLQRIGYGMFAVFVMAAALGARIIFIG